MVSICCPTARGRLWLANTELCYLCSSVFCVLHSPSVSVLCFKIVLGCFWKTPSSCASNPFFAAFTWSYELTTGSSLSLPHWWLPFLSTVDVEASVPGVWSHLHTLWSTGWQLSPTPCLLQKLPWWLLQIHYENDKLGWRVGGGGCFVTGIFKNQELGNKVSRSGITLKIISADNKNSKQLSQENSVKSRYINSSCCFRETWHRENQGIEPLSDS